MMIMELRCPRASSPPVPPMSLPQGPRRAASDIDWPPDPRSASGPRWLPPAASLPLIHSRPLVAFCCAGTSLATRASRARRKELEP